MTIQTWVARTTKHFHENNIETAWLDTILLLEAVSGKDRAWILAHYDDSLTHLLTIAQLETLVIDVTRRANHEPIAYILGYKEFYGLQIAVNKHVLIPRPESEDIISVLDDLGPTAGQYLLDVGTGSGALAIAAYTRYPRLIITASDVSMPALTLAKNNAATHNAQIDFVETYLLQGITEKQDFIIANLPYVPPDYTVSSDVLHEPALAVFSDRNGLQLIEELIETTTEHLRVGGYLVLESLPSQMRHIQRIASKNSLVFVKRTGFIQVFRHWK